MEIGLAISLLAKRKVNRPSSYAGRTELQILKSRFEMVCIASQTTLKPKTKIDSLQGVKSDLEDPNH